MENIPIGLQKIKDEAFALLMTIQETCQDNIGAPKLKHLSKMGHTYGLDYMIGNKNYLGKGYGARLCGQKKIIY